MNQNFISKEEESKILIAIREAENSTSGEIRVHIEKNCRGDVLDRAAFIFEKLEMHKTKLRNGVLFYLAFAMKKFAIIGDSGINAKVPENFWEEIKTEMTHFFKEGKFAEGLTKGIEMTGNHLKKHFPFEKNDVNELKDDISFGKM